MANVSPAQFVRQVRQEINRVTWASRKETGSATLTVFIMTAIAALFFYLLIGFFLMVFKLSSALGVNIRIRRGVVSLI